VSSGDLRIDRPYSSAMATGDAFWAMLFPQIEIDITAQSPMGESQSKGAGKAADNQIKVWLCCNAHNNTPYNNKK
jgi:hypothetical protein